MAERGWVRAVNFAWYRAGMVAASLSVAMVVSAGCAIELRDPDADAPDAPGSLTVTAVAANDVLFEQERAELSASASGADGPFVFRWNVNSQPNDAEVSVETREDGTGVSDPLDVPGSYTFRVVATAADGSTASGFVMVSVAGSVEVTAPPFVLVDSPVTLGAVPSEDEQFASVSWEVTAGSATVDPPDALETQFTASAAETIRVRFIAERASGTLVSRELEIVAAETNAPRIDVATSRGTFVIELAGEATPAHAANMLAYADDGFFEGLLIHRIAFAPEEPGGEESPFVMQGGGFERDDDGEIVLREPTRMPVESEAESAIAAGLTNGTLYSVSLALAGGDASSGTTQFFVNLRDNAFLDDQGFTVFGQVVEGTDIVDAIVQIDRVENPVLGGEVSLPAEDVIIEFVTRSSQ